MHGRTVRSYAKAIGVDPESTVDEFCRCFPHGDRRAALVIRGQAENRRPRRSAVARIIFPRRWAMSIDAARPRWKPSKAAAAPGTAFSQMFVRLRALLRT